MAIIRYSYPLAHLQQQLNQMFDEFDRANEHTEAASGAGFFRPAIDVREDAQAYIIHLEAPGIPQENLQISLQDNTLIIRGFKEQCTDAAGQFRRIERTYGRFSRGVKLPLEVDGDRISAHLSDGVLEVRLPKSDKSKPRQIAISNTRDAATQSVPQSAPESSATNTQNSAND